MTTERIPSLKPDAEYLRAFTAIMSRIERALGAKRPRRPVVACVAGGAALHFYTGSRVSKDIDAKIMARVLLDPKDLQVAYRGQDGHARLLYFDTQYNDTFALLHEHAYDDALPLPLPGIDSRRLQVRLLTPLDLAVSKMSRWSEQDQLDVLELARGRLIGPAALRKRALEALPNYVGNRQRIENTIEIACHRIAAETGEKPAAKKRLTRKRTGT